jgi:hypothetical protein
MGECRLTPAGVEKPNAGILISHVSGSSFNGAPVGLKEQSALLPSMLD